MSSESKTGRLGFRSIVCSPRGGELTGTESVDPETGKLSGVSFHFDLGASVGRNLNADMLSALDYLTDLAQNIERFGGKPWGEDSVHNVQVMRNAAVSAMACTRYGADVCIAEGGGSD